jgi:hypothetical protein
MGESKYGLRCNAAQAGRATSSQSWKILRKLKVLGKINIFGWRALRGLYHAVSSWQITVSGDRGGCPVCNNGVEDVKHMLFTCDRAREVWKEFGI